MNTVTLMMAILAVTSADHASKPSSSHIKAAPLLARAPAHDSAIIQSHRLGGNFAYSTHEANAYALKTPIIGHRTVPIGVSYHQGEPIVHSSTNYVTAHVPRVGYAYPKYSTSSAYSSPDYDYQAAALGYGYNQAPLHGNHVTSASGYPHGIAAPGYSHEVAGPVYGHGIGSPIYGHEGGAPIYGHGLAGPVYGYESAGPVYGYESAGPVYGYESADPVYGYEGAGPVYGHGIGSPVYGHEGAAPVYGHDIGAPVHSHSHHGTGVHSHGHHGTAVHSHGHHGTAVHSHGHHGTAVHSHGHHGTAVPVHGHHHADVTPIYSDNNAYDSHSSYPPVYPHNKITSTSHTVVKEHKHDPKY